MSVDELDREDFGVAHDILWEQAMRATSPWEAWLLRSSTCDLAERTPATARAERWLH